jgi:diaminohydroxyphosphoribosylaminopyrimidine deaminase/5-amino-6-(5-phosphoribosylamino)uracil reductase
MIGPATVPAEPSTQSLDDVAHMRAALALAERGLGTTWPNPSVGCVIVRHGRVVGRGRTQPGGRPHAEPEALAMAGTAALGATAYVTLEPCCHWGRSPPCTDALIKAGVARVVIAATDPDPRVNHQGITQLRAAGITVVTGVLEQEARETLAGFLLRIEQGRPLVTLKLATTLDGRIATATGESQWITGPPARRFTHALRGRHDAVMAGIGTVLADDPELTCRIAGFRPTPVVRVIADSHLRTPPNSRLARAAHEAPCWLLARPDADPTRRSALEATGVRVLPVPAGDGGLDIVTASRVLAEAGLTRVMVEGGGRLAAALMRADLVDRIAWFHAPAVMGGDGKPGVHEFGITELARMPRFCHTHSMALGGDTLSLFTRRG